MIPWKNPLEELPENGRLIWILAQGPAKDGPISIEIAGGRVHVVETQFVHQLRAENQDGMGRGWSTWLLKDFKAKDERWKERLPVAWCYDDELELPKWLELKQS